MNSSRQAQKSKVEQVKMGLTTRRTFPKIKGRWPSRRDPACGVWSVAPLHTACQPCRAYRYLSKRSKGKIGRRQTSCKTPGEGQPKKIRAGSCLRHTAAHPACERSFEKKLQARRTTEKQMGQRRRGTNIKISTACPIFMLKNSIKALQHVLLVYQLRKKHTRRP